MPVKPVIATNPNTGEKLQLVNNTWVPVQDSSTSIPKVDPAAFQDAQNSIEDLSGLEGRANPLTTGLLPRIPVIGKGGLNQAAYDLEADIKPIMARGMIGRMMQMKIASPTGATGFGNLSEQEGDLIRSTMGNLDIGQSTPQFKKNVGRVREILQRSYPGLTPDNPIDLSAGQSRTQVPKGSWYKDPYSNIRRNDNMDKGNPKLQGIKQNDPYAKYGLERKK
jgi:hypothetical protein